MTTTGAAPAARPGRVSWPDLRPAETVTAVVLLVVGLLVVVLGTLQLLVPVMGAEPAGALHQLVVGGMLLAVAGLSVSRPGPQRLHVVLYRVAWVAVLVPVAASTLALLPR